MDARTLIGHSENLWLGHGHTTQLRDGLKHIQIAKEDRELELVQKLDLCEEGGTNPISCYMMELEEF